jgi:hypothetical protein
MARPACLLAAAALPLLLVGCTDDPGGPDPRPAASASALRLSEPRAVHRATALADGRVLITGGCTEPGCGGFEEGRRAELYDAATGLVPGSVMATPRASGTATLLPDGRVLLTGGYPGEGRPPTGTAEVYDPERDEFEAVGDLATARADQTATLLADGSVLVAGGFGPDGAALASTELFDPRTGTFRPGPGLSGPRAAHVAVLAGDTVLLVGGTVGSAALATTDVLLDGRWSPGPALLTPRVKLGVAPLRDGRVLVVGGSADTEGHDRLATTELVDLDRGTVAPGPSLRRGEYKLDGAVVALPDGRVVVPSGDGLEVLDAAAERFTALPGTTYDAGSFRTVTALSGASVLVAGGYDDRIVPTDRAVVVRIPPAPAPVDATR